MNHRRCLAVIHTTNYRQQRSAVFKRDLKDVSENADNRSGSRELHKAGDSAIRVFSAKCSIG